jgi:hypothetical protein
LTAISGDGALGFDTGMLPGLTKGEIKEVGTVIGVLIWTGTDAVGVTKGFPTGADFGSIAVGLLTSVIIVGIDILLVGLRIGFMDGFGEIFANGFATAIGEGTVFTTGFAEGIGGGFVTN